MFPHVLHLPLPRCLKANTFLVVLYIHFLVSDIFGTAFFVLFMGFVLILTRLQRA